MTTASYPVVSHFHTIQGEGAWSGHAAYFIRLAGCDVGCPWCDTKESWTVEGHPVLTVEELRAAVLEAQTGLVVVTGGEPTMHDLAPLAKMVSSAGCRVHLETSGAYELSGRFDWVTLSPKKYKPPVDSIYTLADELKVVIANKSDFKWAESHRSCCADDVKFMLQPEWDSPHMIKPIVEYVKKNPDWTISLQTHKYLNVS
jgi:organic radical activating enzyme